MNPRKLPKCPIPGYAFAYFDSWSAVQAHVSKSATVYYWAPFDEYPRSVPAKLYKSGNVRVDYLFTADNTHLERFVRIERMGP